MNQSGSLPANARLESMANHKSADFSQRMNTYFKKTNTYFIRFFLRRGCGKVLARFRRGSGEVLERFWRGSGQVLRGSGEHKWLSKYPHELFQSLQLQRLQRIHDQSLMLQKNSELVAFVDSVWQELMSSEVARNLHCLFHLLDRRVYKRFWRESGEVLERFRRGSR